MSELFVEFAYAQVPKKGEELCGDSVNYDRTKDFTIFSWSDGLGSGVKANILSTLTSRIIVSMLRKNSPLEEVIETLVETLPVCKVRKIAYSTFSVVQVASDGEAYVAEFDNPPIFWIRSGRVMYLEKHKHEVGKKVVLDFNVRLQKNDWIVGVTDGVVHAGIGGLWNLGWRWEKIASFLESTVNEHMDAQTLAQKIIDTTKRLYQGQIGDDATCVVAKIRLPRRLILWAGPPEDPAQDEKIVEKVLHFPGKKVVSGGTTGNILARVLRKEIRVDFSSLTQEVPPVGMLEGVDLLTEGILTLATVLRRLRKLQQGGEVVHNHDGASRLLHLFLEADEILIIGGRAINPAHQNPKLSGELSLKVRVLEEIGEELRRMGKMVTLEYC
ncbi:MAG: SpoIIE family protein phosphatase [Candidatus Caldatribacteriaceae bacterium]